MVRVLALVWSGLWTLPTLLFVFYYFDSYWRHRDCFTETGGCFDERDGLVYHDNSFVAIILALLCLIPLLSGLWLAWAWRKPAKTP
jgi:hypothetical protein